VTKARSGGDRLGTDKQNRNRTPAPRGTVEDWLASKLSSLGDDDDETTPEPEPDLLESTAVDQDTRRGGPEDVELEDDDDAATVHDDQLRPVSGAHAAPAPANGLGRIVARAPVSPELPLLTGRGRRAPDSLDPDTDRFDTRQGHTDPGDGEPWSPDVEETAGPGTGPLAWDELDPRELTPEAPAEDTGVLLSRTDPSIPADHQPTEFDSNPTAFDQLAPPPGFLDLPLAGEGDEPHTQWEAEPRRAPSPAPVPERTQVRFSPPGALHRIIGDHGDDDDEMPTVIAQPGQQVFPPLRPPPRPSGEPTVALPEIESTGPVATVPRATPTPPTRTLPGPPAPPTARPATEGAGFEFVWIASAIGALLALAALALVALGWLSLQ
jgi:hypothetical protein